MIGTKLAHYEITSHLGTGGMGEVYQAMDSKLGRSVAIKLLPEAFTHNHDRASRFEREARALAALNHSNIAAIYGVEETGGRKFLVMELVPGETLAEKIKRGPIPFDEAMVIARAIAEGLEAAHEKGVIHRDLKPANIKVTPDGKVKILDFGLAKAYDTDTSDTNVSNSPTISVAATNAGIILGTAGYMSPEQASGRPVDKRADIWSFGVVLWEMLTGHTLFGGETVTHTLADVLRGPIDFNALPSTVPEKVRKLLRRCLDRDAKSRLRDIGEARIAIDEPVDSANPVAAPPAVRSSLAWILVAALLAIALSALAFTHFREPAASQGAVIQTEITLPEEFRIGVSVLSPDGTKMVFAGSSGTGRVQLYVRPLAARSFTTVPGSELASTPFWSPNSESIAFGKDGKLWKWSLTSGQPPQIICTADIQPNGQGTWSEQDVILFAEADKPIQRVPASGGVPRNALELDSDFGEQAHVTPSFLPGGKAFLYSSNGKVRGSQFFATLDGKIRRHLQDSLNSPASFVTTPSGTGFLVYVSNEQLLVRRMNSDTGELTGDAALLIDGIVNGPTFSFASGRYLTYIPTPNRKSRMRWIVDGKPGEVLGEAGQLSGPPDVSGDGRRILYSKRDAGKYETWLLDLTHGTTERLLSGNTPQSAIWTPDNRIVYSRNDAKGGQIIERPADTLGAETTLASIPGNAGIHIRNISDDGKLIAVSAGGGGLSEAWLVSRPEGKVRIAKLEGRTGGTSELSPNGRWLALFTGREIVLRPVPADADSPLASGGQQIASLARGRAPMHWSADGNQLLGISDEAMMSIPIDWTGGTPHAGPPRKLFDVPKAFDFDVTSDSHRFLVLENVGDAPNPTFVLIQNWSALLGN